MFNAMGNTQKFLLVCFVAKPNQLEQKLCIAKYFLVLTALHAGLLEKDINMTAAYVSLERTVFSCLLTHIYDVLKINK